MEYVGWNVGTFVFPIVVLNAILTIALIDKPREPIRRWAAISACCWAVLYGLTFFRVLPW